MVSDVQAYYHIVFSTKNRTPVFHPEASGPPRDRVTRERTQAPVARSGIGLDARYLLEGSPPSGTRSLSGPSPQVPFGHLGLFRFAPLRGHTMPDFRKTLCGRAHGCTPPRVTLRLFIAAPQAARQRSNQWPFQGHQPLRRRALRNA